MMLGNFYYFGASKNDGNSMVYIVKCVWDEI